MLSPLRKEHLAKKWWRVIYPIVVHFLIFQAVGGIFIGYFVYMYGNSKNIYYDNAVVATGLSGICTVFPALFLYRKDKIRRMAGGLLPGTGKNKISVRDGAFLLILGAGCAHFFNLVVGILQIVLQSTQYQESMELMTSGKGIWMLIFWMGIVAPVSEEITFRWLIYLRLRDYLNVRRAAVISGVIFGLYHGNLLQAVYATILGIIFAYVLEATGNLFSSVLLHIGANVWSLVITEISGRLLNSRWLNVLGIAIFVLFVVSARLLQYFFQKGRKRNERCI